MKEKIEQIERRKRKDRGERERGTAHHECIVVCCLHFVGIECTQNGYNIKSSTNLPQN